MTTVLGDLGRTNEGCEQLVQDVRRFFKDLGRSAPVIDERVPIRLALFGQYNAGKSTLVNALLKKHVAVTGDAPETKLAQVYKVDGFEIVDLPGGDARVQESEEALRALGSAHAVLYLVSSATGFDYQTLWDDLQLLTGRGIPFLIVVNDKKPHQDEESEQRFRQQVIAHFHEVASKRLSGQTWTNRFFWVRAKSAERGRLEGKDGLVAGSGIVPLEHALAGILRDSEALLRDAARLRKLQEALSSVRRTLEDSEEAASLRGVEQALQRCEVARERLETAARLVMEDSFSPLRDSISAVLRRAIAGRSTEKADVLSEVSELVSGTYEGALAAFQGRCEAELTDLATQIGRDVPNLKAPKFADPVLHLGEVPSVEASGVDVTTILRRFAAGAAAFKEAVRSAEGAVAAVASTAAKQVAKSAAEETGKAIVRKGAVAAEAGGQAAAAAGKEGAKTAGKIIGPILLFAVAALEIFDGFRAAQREKDTHAAAAREADAKADLAARTARQQFMAAASALVSGALSPVERACRDELRARSRATSDVAARLSTLAELAARTNSLLAGLTDSATR
jgi:signal recognition particle receptor subunit beta